MNRTPAENLALDHKLAETATMLRELAIHVGDSEVAQRADRLERQAGELATLDQLRAAGLFAGGGLALPGEGVSPLGSS